jgi:RimJ/RimL family protein N-acetyltransferase
VSVPISIEHVETSRLICERVRAEHFEALAGMLQDPRVGLWLWPIGEPPTEEELRESLTDKLAHWEKYGFGIWLLRDKATGEAVGRGGLQWTYVAELHEVEVMWTIVPERWGEGLATELALCSVEVGFGPLGLMEIVAFTLPDNVASRRVMEKAGFAYERDIVHAMRPHVLYRREAGVAER